MAGLHSKLTVFKLDTSGGVLTDISTYLNEVSVPRELDLLKVTTFGATDHAYITGFGDATITVGGPWTRAADNFFAPIFAASKAGTLASSTFEYGPEGADTGDVKQTGECVITNYEVSSSIEDPIEFTAEFQVTGGITVTTY